MTAMFLPKHNLTFVHIPKNAGTSIIKWFTKYKSFFDADPIFMGHHESLPMIAKVMPCITTFAVVRNPYDRLVSFYTFARDGQTEWCIKFRQANGLEEFPDFATWVDRLESYDTLHWFKTTTNQFEWIPNGVTHLLRTESLDNDFKPIQDIVDFGVTLDVNNKSDHELYKNLYTDKEKNKVAKLFEKDLDLYKYTF